MIVASNRSATAQQFRYLTEAAKVD